jgi:predicted nuclease of predicted toxin-antitoxin system
MRFLVDENAGVVVARWLRSQGHEVFSVYEEARGSDDETILQKAFDENWILITSDKDFIVTGLTARSRRFKSMMIAVCGINYQDIMETGKFYI